MSGIGPRGMSGQLTVAGALSGGAAAMNPSTLALLPMTSPRLVGEAAHAGGRVAGAMSTPMQSMAGKMSIKPKTLAEVARQSGRAQRLSDDEYSNTKITSLRR